ncbi:Metallo-dependent phosphatase-like protein [Catenaria anguillulae PL171]|uniref:Vacuolar protein sorting-associated protein 29 n=1 Tax=Catenaria anguillulae PL171 TaxID=765915 RepID=A0A1Y2H493_9FUNG|nr:Metallo-dependent phosphatase-like protein [Catenaria anguillulae PL171]
MVLILAIGDLHTPHRALDLPAPFRKLLMPGKIHMVLCTGNLTMSDTADWLRSIAPTVHIVQGDLDTLSSTSAPHPLFKVVAVGPLRIGLIHGHSLVPVDDTESLAMAARQLDVDVLVSGASSMGVDCFEFEGRFFVNPGSATGTGGAAGNAFPGAPTEAANQTPSFVLMDVVDTKVTAYVYQCEVGSDEVKIVKLEYVKPAASAESPAGAAAVGADGQLAA